MNTRLNRVYPMTQQGLAVIALLTTSTAIFAEDSKLTLDSAIRESLAANPSLQANFQTVEAARLVGIQRGALPDPKVTYSEFLSSVQTRTGPQERAVSVSQMAPWPGKLKLARRIADTKAQQAYYSYEAERRATIEELGGLYFDYAYLAVAEDIAEQNQELLEQLVPVVKERVRAGGDLAATLRLEVEVARIEDQIQTIQQKRPAMSSRLARVLGREASMKSLPFPDFPGGIPDVSDLEKLQPQLKDHPLVAAAREGVIAADQAVKLAAKSGQPDLSFGVNVIDIGLGGETAVAATLGFSIPFSQKKYKAEKEEAEHRAEAARFTTEDVLLELITRLHVAHQALTENKNRLALYDDKLIPSASQAVELTKESYRSNKATLTDLIDTERTILQLRLERARSLATAHQAAITIRALVEGVPKGAGRK